jgi:7-cyano-7-deazaguanine reductase
VTDPADFGLSALGRNTDYPTEPSVSILEAFDNPNPGVDYVITFDCPEFTSMCPVTGQPDFGRWRIEYCPNARCLESKSLKLYLFSWRNQPGFWETLTGRIAADVQSVLETKWVRVSGFMAPRGGISITTSLTLGDHALAERMLRLQPLS